MNPLVSRTVLATLLMAASGIAPAQSTADAPTTWATTWTASPQPLWAGDFVLPTNVPYNLWNQTVRQTARVSIGGRRVRVLLSNEYGTQPLRIGAARIAGSASAGRIVAASDRPLTFGGKISVTIPPGAPMLSDPVDLDVPALGDVAVSLYLPEPTPPATFHWDARQTTYVGAGDQTAASAIKAETTLSTRVFLSAIQVQAAPSTRSVVALGDSITDGNMSTVDHNRRWPDFLARRLAGQDVAVLNAGISGARLLQDKMGSNALARFERDVLSQPGLAAAVVFIGINDIGWNGTAFAPSDPAARAEDLIAGYRQLIARAHTRGVRIVGATLTPFEGALQDTPMRGYYGADKERVRQAVNAWIRDSGEFDAVLDFDKVTRDPSHPARFLAAYDSGDHLHPGDAGYQAMAESIDLGALLGDEPAVAASADYAH
ncbi:SGNH/GDSL hydrolase family protein [Lysobacter sp. S4-A87]|uniref:SGNH/GDSL hydrolase family protein n=1 Tax=Lysobacter sp. S4-A87 TaxID=2925843 RepID=UPI001F53AE7D|nr:SGNH/GDSL hydrolase family protein [Lysobacter sp. S4-A87]UNK49202.1 SGNH/GDSL hydrolase family protein [Lysobacter sp. S4-A87]